MSKIFSSKGGGTSSVFGDNFPKSADAIKRNALAEIVFLFSKKSFHFCITELRSIVQRGVLPSKFFEKTSVTSLFFAQFCKSAFSLNFSIGALEVFTHNKSKPLNWDFFIAPKFGEYWVFWELINITKPTLYLIKHM